MDKWKLAEKLYKAGYCHDEVKRIWAYVWNEQHVGSSIKKKKKWECEALEEISASIDEIEFTDYDNGEIANYH